MRHSGFSLHANQPVDYTSKFHLCKHGKRYIMYKKDVLGGYRLSCFLAIPIINLKKIKSRRQCQRVTFPLQRYVSIYAASILTRASLDVCASA